MKIKLSNLAFFYKKKLLLAIMKTFIFLICATSFGFTTNSAFSQNEKIVIDSDKLVSVDEIFDIIKSQTDYRFVYKSDLFKDLPKIQLTKGVILLSELIEKSLYNDTLEFEFTSTNSILIKKRDPNQQQLVVTGKVTDKNGIPLPGVNIYNAKKTYGVSTDFDGNFTLRLPSGTTEIVFSYVGYSEKSLMISELSSFDNITVVLDEEVNSLQEVVVTGYQRLPKERTAGSIETVSSEQLEQRPAAVSFVDRIVGQVPGVNVSPWSGKIEIRGRSTVFNGYDNVLIVVDGFPLTRQEDFETINPEDIESINVLKDAAASSVWGAKASNGVIVVTTKRGNKNSKLKINFSSFIDMEQKPDLDDMQLISVSDEIDMELEYLEKRWLDVTTLPNFDNSINDLYLAEIYRSGASPDGNVWSQNTYNNFVNGLRNREDVTKQFEKYLLRSAVRNVYNLSLSAGGERNSVFASMSYTDQQEQSIGNENSRLTFNVRNVFEYNDKIKLTAGVTAVVRNERDNGINASSVRQLQSYDQLIDENGQYVQKYFNWNPWLSQERESLLGSPMTYNVVEEQRNLDNSYGFLDVRADIAIDFELFDGFTYSPSFRYERGAGQRDIYKNMSLPSHRNFINDFYSNGQYQIPVGSDYTQDYEYYKGWTFRNLVNYDKSFGKHEITVLAGIDYQRRFTESSLNRHFGYSKQATAYTPFNETGLFNNSITRFNGTRPTEFFWPGAFYRVQNDDDRFVSYFSNLGYAFDGKYLLNASYRVDQANIYGSDPDIRYKPLWSVGLGWEIGKENFMENVSWVDRLKVRATYGLGGNTLGAASPYAAASTRTNTYAYPYFFARLTTPANPNLKWEETATTNLGLDFSLFQNRVSGSVDYYSKISTDVYSRRPLDPTVGYETATVNYAGIDNKGLEFQLNYKVIDRVDFGWDVSANFNWNKNEVTEFTASTETASYLSGGFGVQEGAAVNNYYSYRFAGLNEFGEVMAFDKDGVAQHWTHDFVKEDLEYSGSKTPQQYGGLSTRLRYKNFDLTVNLNYAGDYVFRLAPGYSSTSYGSWNNNTSEFSNLRIHRIWADRWQQPGDEQFTNVPRLYYNGLNPNTGMSESRFRNHDLVWYNSTFNTLKGDYIRIQDIILGYNLPDQVIDRTFLESLRVTFQVANPFLWVANDYDIDPTLGFNQRATGNLTRFTFGLRAQL